MTVNKITTPGSAQQRAANYSWGGRAPGYEQLPYPAQPQYNMPMPMPPSYNRWDKAPSLSIILLSMYSHLQKTHQINLSTNQNFSKTRNIILKLEWNIAVIISFGHWRRSKLNSKQIGLALNCYSWFNFAFGGAWYKYINILINKKVLPRLATYGLILLMVEFGARQSPERQKKSCSVFTRNFFWDTLCMKDIS